MKKLYLAAVLCAFVAVPALAQQAAVATPGKVLVAAGGARLGPVYRVGVDGSAQVIIEGRLVSIPSSTLSVTEGKLTTSLSKKEVASLR